MGKLTDAKLRAMRANGKIQKITDGDGLYIFMNPTGQHPLWRFDYRFGERRKTLALGRYPEITLLRAREKALEARRMLAEGIDPAAAKQEKKAAVKAEEQRQSLTFRIVAERWYNKHKDSIVPSTRKKTRWYLDTIYTYFGDTPFADLERTTLVEAVQDLQEKISPHMAHRVAGLLNRICLYAWDCGYTDRNIADRINKSLKPQKTRHRAALTDPVQLGELLRKIQHYGGEGFSVRCCLKIIAYLALRSEELRGARWAELDLDAAVWTIPAKRHEHGGGMKMRIEHTIPLPRQVVALFRELKHDQLITLGDCDLCFPGPRNRNKPITGESLLVALKVLHGSSNITIHGFRTSFSTLAREKGFDPAVIEKQLAHVEKNSVIAAYDRSTYFDQRRELMQAWADYLDGLRDGKM